jgi:5'-nucleotidase
MINRRHFLTTSLVGGAGLALASRLPESFAFAPTVEAFIRPDFKPGKGETLITILHTNDQHSQIDPLPDNDRNAGKGGAARRATLVKRIRRENPNTLLLDAGDAFQGTPYFNLYKGEAEFKAMSSIGYDAMTLGNHDFDNGVQALADAMKFATFEFVSTNYDVRGTAIEKRVKPYLTRTLGGIKIGVLGFGIKLEGLNPPESYTGVKVLDPLRMATGGVKLLREQLKCQMVVAASHLGYYPSAKDGEFGDSQLAAQVDGIDFIASGHTHTFMEKPVTVKQPGGGQTVIFQVGKSGIYLGRVDFLVSENQVVAHSGKLLEDEHA